MKLISYPVKCFLLNELMILTCMQYIKASKESVLDWRVTALKRSTGPSLPRSGQHLPLRIGL